MMAHSGDNQKQASGTGGSRIVSQEAVVISGVSTLMPDSRDLQEFSDKLYGKVNLVKSSSPRWRCKYPELVPHHGIVPDVDRFDAQFFMVHPRLSNNMDPMARKFLEHSYQAIYDAGISPSELSGKSVGVFVATGFCESEKACASGVYMGIVGCNRAMFANRISYYLNLRGPSLTVDADSAGSAVALEKACASIMSGQCEAALVGGAKIMLHPQASLHYHKLIPCNKDGNVKSYDMNADGHSLSEGVSNIFLQKYKDAKRVYASIRHIKTSFSGSSKPGEYQKFGPYRDPARLTKFLHEFYEEVAISPSEVEYVEGFGAGILDADKAELEAIDGIFCKGRQSPLPVGSVMSTVGFTESASCLTSIIKVLLGYQTGKLAANINFTSPRMDIPAVAECRIRILSEHERFGRGLAAVNNFSIGGVNGHVLLEGVYKPKDLFLLYSNLPQLVVVSGRQESSVQRILDHIKNHLLDPEEIALLANIHKIRIPKQMARGFGIYTKGHGITRTKALQEEVDYYDDTKRPLWFVYSGMGSQWPGMGAQLMRIPIFADAIHRCHKVLEPKGIDLLKVLTAPKKEIFDNILNSFVGIAAVQIGLTDVLRAIGLIPDNIIGHSVGELGCAYADGCLTAEEMILMAYGRGLVSIQTPFITGSMAAVGIGFKKISKILPPEIEVACHNGPDSSTISGPADKMKDFVAELTAKGIFAKEVPCSNIAYHSRYIAEAGPRLLKFLKNVVSVPKPRTERWVSTSIPQDKWNESLAKYSSAEYHTNNLLSPVLFEETLKLIPSNSVLVEIAPHGLLQAILKRSLPADCKHVPLTRRGPDDNAIYMLRAIGKLYMEGYDVDISPLYPIVEFPVSTETRSLSPLVEWMYPEKFKVCQYFSAERKTVSVYKPIVSIYDEEFSYLSGNIINGKNVFPFSGALCLVWETLAMILGKTQEQVTVQFKDVHLYMQPLVKDDKTLPLSVSLQKGSGRFEVTYGRNLIATGNVTAVAQITDLPYLKPEDLDNSNLKLTETEIYKILYEKGYQYINVFRSIQKANMALTRAKLSWNNNWATFIDAALQLIVLRREHKGISQPKYIKRLCIDVKQHTLQVASSKHENGAMEAIFSEIHNTIRCGGLTIEHVNFTDKPSLLRQHYVLKELTFVPFNQENCDINTSLYIFLQIISENLAKTDLNIYYIGNQIKPCEFEQIKDLLNSPPEIKYTLVAIKKSEITFYKEDFLKSDIVFLDNVLQDKNVFEALYHILPPNTFVINLIEGAELFYPTSMYRMICRTRDGIKILELSKFRPMKYVPTTAALSVRNTNDMKHLNSIKLSDQQKMLILASSPPLPGLKEVVTELNSESKNVYMVMISDDCVVEEDMELPSHDLIFNVLNDGIWGGEYFVPVKAKIDTSAINTELQISQFGDIDSLKWIDRRNGFSRDGIPVKVHYAGLNVHDVKRAVAEISLKNSADKTFGMDFSGVTDRGTRVMGLVSNGALRGHLCAQPELLWPVPSHWTLEDAASVPLPYCLAFYCLAIRAKTSRHFRQFRGMNVLIHGGAGALGQAAISICLAHHCNVFTTVSDVQKKRLLKKMFPDLPANHIGNSRNRSFVDMVLGVTKGEGCQIIISSVSGELKHATLRCCAATGIILDTAVLQNQENFAYGMFNMMKSTSYATVDFYSIFENNHLEEMKALQRMLSEGIAQGYVRPLTRVTYSPRDVPSAMRLLAASRHRGRVLVDLLEPVPVVQARILCSLNESYLILCDRQDFGLQLADRLVNNGATRVYIHHPEPTPFLEFKQLAWQKQGIEIHVSSESIDRMEAKVNLLKDCNRIAHIDGIFIVRIDQTNEIQLNNLVCELDSILKELFLDIRHFALIHNGGIGNVITNKVRKVNLKSIQLHNLDKFNIREKISMFNNDTLKWECALNGVESALNMKNSIFSVCTTQAIRQTILLEDVKKITRLDIDLQQEDISLELMGIDQVTAQAISNVLEEKYDVIMTKDNVMNMTVSRLRKLQDKWSKSEQESSGLKAFFNYIEPNELLANCNVVLMRTRLHSSESVLLQRTDEFDSELRYLCIVPGLEGSYQRFSTLCERLKVPALVLQPGFDIIGETLEEMALRFIDIMKTKHILNDHFYLLGYECGIIVALEMALQMENEGLTGTIYCLGCNPEDILEIINGQFVNIDSEELQNQLINYLFTLITETESKELMKEIHKVKEWKDKVALCTNMARDKHSYSNGYINAILDAYYTRVTKIRNYIFKGHKLRSKIVVLKAILPFNSKSSSDNSVVSHNLPTSLSQITEDLRCSAIVNNYLEPDLLYNYYKMNRCESSLYTDTEELAFSYIQD